MNTATISTAPSVGDWPAGIIPCYVYAGLKKEVQNLVKFRNSSAEIIIKRIARVYGLEPSDITGPCRRKDLAEARHIAQYLILQRTRLPLKAIGKYFGGRDHSSVVHARDKVLGLLDVDKRFRAEFERVEKLV